MKRFTRFTLVVFLGALVSTATVFAQQQQMPPQPEPLSPEEVTDEHLEMVANVSQAAQGIQQEADQKMRGIVEDEGMEYTRFQQIMMAQQNPQMAGQLNMTEEEKKTLQKLQPQLQKVNNQARQQYMSAIQEEGLTPQKFQRIALSIQTHDEVAQRFQEIQNNTTETDGDG